MIEARLTNSENKDFNALILELDADLSERYQTDQEKFNHHNKIKDTAKVIVIYKEGEPVACGCYRPMEEPSVVEIKRMYVKPTERGKGFAKLILDELISSAKKENVTTVRLETGIKQPEAISLYSKYGFYQIEKYGAYKHIAESVCMEKRIDS